jgi:phosphoglycolate phosphatase
MIHDGCESIVRGAAALSLSKEPALSLSKGRVKYRLAIFDFDGTLADSLRWLAGVMGGVADKYGFRVDAADWQTLRGLTTRQLLAHLRLPAWKLPWVASHLRKLQARDIDQIVLFEGVSQMLQRLADSGITLAVVSSNAEQNVRRVLGRETAGLISHYDCGASLFGKRAKLRTVLRKSNVTPADSIYVGDETRDIEAAKSLGMASGAVSWGYSTPDALRSLSPTVIFASPGEVTESGAGSGTCPAP